MPDSPKRGSRVQPKLDELIPLNKAVEIGGLTPSRWRQLFRSGEVWGIKMGRDWFTTSQAVREYIARPRQPGPKRETSA